MSDLCCSYDGSQESEVCSSKTESFAYAGSSTSKLAHRDCGQNLVDSGAYDVVECIYPRISYGTCSNYFSCYCVSTFGINLNFGIAGIILLGGALLAIFFISHLLIRDKTGKTNWKLGANLMFYTLVPVLDTISNLMVLTNSDWASPYLFACAWFFYFAPASFFFYQLYRDGIQMYNYYPLGIPKEYLFDRYDTCSKLMITFIVGLPYMFVFWIRHLLLIPHLLWLMVGYFLFITKVMCIGRVQRFWHRIWTGKTDTTHNHIIDQRQLNEQYFTILTMQSIPWLILQSVNAKFLRSASPIQIASLVISGMMIVAGLYRYAFHLLFDRIPIGSVPIPMSMFFDIGLAYSVEEDNTRVQDEKGLDVLVASPFTDDKMEPAMIETTRKSEVTLRLDALEHRFAELEEQVKLLKNDS